MTPLCTVRPIRYSSPTRSWLPSCGAHRPTQAAAQQRQPVTSSGSLLTAAHGAGCALFGAPARYSAPEWERRTANQTMHPKPPDRRVHRRTLGWSTPPAALATLAAAWWRSRREEARLPQVRQQEQSQEPRQALSRDRVGGRRRRRRPLIWDVHDVELEPLRVSRREPQGGGRLFGQYPPYGSPNTRTMTVAPKALARPNMNSANIISHISRRTH